MTCLLKMGACDPLYKDPPHKCYSSIFGHSRSNSWYVITAILQTLCVSPFKVYSP